MSEARPRRKRKILLIMGAITVLLFTSAWHWIYRQEARMIREAREISTYNEIEAFGDKYGCLWRHDRGATPEVFVLTKMTELTPAYVRSVSFRFTLDEEAHVAKCEVEKFSATYVRKSIRAYWGL